MNEQVTARARSIALGHVLICTVLQDGRIQVQVVQKRKLLDAMHFDNWLLLLQVLDESVRAGRFGHVAW